jgi:alkanesulfonate monooxygenase SsuD/methylene tetrahydromethanopterin reductase-like flavin-dependent oxidoreductase (luciferase family)
MVDEDGDHARRLQRDYLRKLGADPDAMSDEQFRTATRRHVVGTPDDVAADLQRRILDPGVDGVIVNLVPNGHQPGVVTMVGEMLGKLVR